ncbi:unnamed protein product [Parnassius apollo]|uniref:(apollo) hypothetical protein n=1 Tax=Parnassius apollo TaxID=110799 RepID=A0A8S3Y5L6_PARAO|nr:unnamed protein product [Parnassius apollo]
MDSVSVKFIKNETIEKLVTTVFEKQYDINGSHSLGQVTFDLDINKSNITKLEITADSNDNDEFNTTKQNKCDNIVNTITEEPIFETNSLNSIYLNNIYSSVTTNLIEDNVSIENIDSNGVSLFDIVRNDCGGAKMCSDFSENWNSKNTITIGFLSAYGYSQVSIRNILCL